MTKQTQCTCNNSNVITKLGKYENYNGECHAYIYAIEGGIAYGLDKMGDGGKYDVVSGSWIDSFGYVSQSKYLRLTKLVDDYSQECCEKPSLFKQAEEPLTPAQRLGWSVGDVGVVMEYQEYKAKGDLLELVEDDRSDTPYFKNLCNGKLCCAVLEYPDGHTEIVRLGTKEHLRDILGLSHDNTEGIQETNEKPLTPAQQAGWNVGDVGVVEKSSTIKGGSLVELYEDDGSDVPLWKVIKGHSHYNKAGGSMGAYLWLDRVTKIYPKD